jgi:hypothetical protein
MKSLLRHLTTSAIVAGLFTSSVLAATPAGSVDFGTFEPAPGREFVEIDINPALLKLAAAFAEYEDPEIAAIIAGLEHVKVNVIGIEADQREAAVERIEIVRADLDAQGWNRVVTVRESAGDDVAIFTKQNDDASIQGVVVTVVGREGEMVLVNVVGDVQLEQIARLGHRLDIEPLRKLNLKPAPVES